MTLFELIAEVSQEIKKLRPDVKLEDVNIAYIDISYPINFEDITVGFTMENKLVITDNV